MKLEFLVDLPVVGLEGLSVTCFSSLSLGRRGQHYLPLSPTNEMTLRLHVSAESPSSHSGEALLSTLRASLGSTLHLDGKRPVAAWLTRAELSFERDETLQYGEFTVKVEMPEAVVFPFEPGRTSPSHKEDPSFAEALVAAFEATRIPCVAAEILETDRYWLIPVRQIGLLGAIVDRRTGRATPMGSAFPREVWIWAWEQGLIDSDTGFVIETCSDFAMLRERLRHIYRLDEAALDELPLELDYDWRALGPLFESRELVRVRAAK